MKRSIVAAIVAVLILTGPAHAQIFPTGASAPPTAAEDHVLTDAIMWVQPPSANTTCMVLEPGQLTVQARRTKDALEQRPAEFRLSGLMADPDANIRLPISAQESTATTRIAGRGHYCWHIAVEAPETDGMSNAQRGAYIQYVAVKMTLAP